MNRTGGIYLVFFITILVAITSTYLMTRTHLGNKYATDKHLENYKVKQKQTQTAQRFASELEARNYLIAIIRINEILNETKLELYKVSLASNNTQRLMTLIKQIHGTQKSNAYPKKTANSKNLTDLLNKINAYPLELIPARNKFEIQINQLKKLSGKIKNLLLVSVNPENLDSLSRQHTLVIGKMLVQISQIKSTLKLLQQDVYTLNFSKKHINQLAKSMVQLNEHNLSLLTGNPQKYISELKTRGARMLQKSIRVHLDLLQKLAQRSASLYFELSSQPVKLKKLLAAIDAQKLRQTPTQAVPIK